MSNIATMSAKVHAMTPEDELIGSLTRERITLLVQEAGNLALTDAMAARCWLAYALSTDIPKNLFEALYCSFVQAEEVKTCDLVLWYDMASTPENREVLQRGADMTIDHCVIMLANALCQQLEVTA